MATITLENYTNLSAPDQKDLCDRFWSNLTAKPLQRKEPYYLPALYCNQPFPSFTHPSCQIRLQDNNILSGHVTYMSVQGRINLKWKGYVSQLYDGELRLGVVSPDASITGQFGEEEFVIGRSQLVRGVPPAFLKIYDESI
jgi:hypothetical protein